MPYEKEAGGPMIPEGGKHAHCSNEPDNKGSGQNVYCTEERCPDECPKERSRCGRTRRTFIACSVGH